MKESEWKEARGREEDAWRLEPEGETAVPETVIVADEVEGIYVDSNGEAPHGRGKSQKSQKSKWRARRGRGRIKSPKRKVIRLEFQETQDYVREAKSTDQEEVEELSFVPSAISVPQRMIFRCDNQCNGKTRSFWQLASVVIRECYNDSLKAQGEKTLANWQWREFAKQKAHRGRLWKMMGKEQYVRGMWEYFRRERD